MIVGVTPDNNWVDDHDKVKVNGNVVRCQNVGQRSTRDCVAQVLRDFCGDTPMHGLGQVRHNTVSMAKVAWMVVFLGDQAGLFLHITNLIQLYRNRPIQETTIVLHKPTRFHDVTVCNLDLISRSNLEVILNMENSSVAQYNARIN